MKNFKPNQKVVFRNTNGKKHPLSIWPKQNEIVTIKCACSVHPNHWDTYEYPFAIDGVLQSFYEIDLFPTEEVFSEQSQEDIESIESEIKQEQLITVKQ